MLLYVSKPIQIFLLCSLVLLIETVTGKWSNFPLISLTKYIILINMPEPGMVISVVKTIYLAGTIVL